MVILLERGPEVNRGNEGVFVAAMRPEDADPAMEGFIPWSSFGYRWHSILAVTKRWTPNTDVFRRDENLVIQIDLPGIDMEDIELSVEEDRLLIRGYRRISQENTGNYYQSPERPSGNFYRTIPLPERVEMGVIEVTYEDGVLEVVIPLTEIHEEKDLEVAHA